MAVKKDTLKYIPNIVLLGRRVEKPKQLYVIATDENVTFPESFFSENPIIARINPLLPYEEKIDLLRDRFMDFGLNFNAYEISGGLVVNRLFRASLIDHIVIPYTIPEENFRRALAMGDRKERELKSVSGNQYLSPKGIDSYISSNSGLEFVP